MTRLKRLLRTLGALTLALPMIAIAGSPAAATPTTPFFADLTYNCTYSYTRGVIDWDPIAGAFARSVDVTGVLVGDQSLCERPPSGETFAIFTGYVDGRRVDEETVYLGEFSRPGTAYRYFSVNLAAPTEPNPIIDQVDVRVCRTAGPMLPAFFCGETQTYWRGQYGPAN